MNKKLKIYSTLFVAVLIVLIVTHVVHYESLGWYQGGHDTLEFVDEAPEFFTRDSTESGGVTTTYHPTYSYEVYVMPKQLHKTRYGGPKMLISSAKWAGPQKVEKQTYRVTMQKVKLETPVTENQLPDFPIIGTVISTVVIAIVTIWILCMVFKLIRRIRKGEIFISQVAKYLEITGYLLSALYLIRWITTYAFTQYCINHIQLTDYYIVYKNEANSMYILTGLALMIISQIILMGKDLKEEQELTI